MGNTDQEKLENLKARYKRQNERIKETYDRSSITFPKGTIDRIKAQGETVNGFLNKLVLAELDRLEADQAAKKRKYTGSASEGEELPFC